MTMVVTILLSIVIIAVAMLFLAIGVMFRGRCLRGTCGGDGVIGPDGEILTCDTCPRRKELEHELELAKKAQAPESKEPSLTSR